MNREGSRSRARTLVMRGSGLALLTMLCTCTGLGMLAFPDQPGQRFSGAMCALMSMAGMGLPSMWMIVLGWDQGRKVRRLDTLVALAATHDRLPFATIATQTGMSIADVNAFVLDAVRNGLVRGRLDVADQVFVSGTVATEIREVTGVCGACGASATVYVGPAGTAACPYCKGPVSPK